MKTEQKNQPGVTVDHSTLRRAYRTIYQSRRLDDKELLLKKQNRIFFQISCAGHEAVLVAAAMHLRPGHDWFYPYYRDRALTLELGLTPYEQLLAAVAGRDDRLSGGRQMPSHWGAPRLNMVSRSSCTGMQFLQAVGTAEAGYRYSIIREIEDRSNHFKSDEIVYVSAGDGATSEGEFWESLNTACNLKLPVFYLIEDNGYAISTPVEVQTVGGSISKLLRDYPGLFVVECDGTSFTESYEAVERVVRHIREQRGPALLHAHVTRPYSHSQSDDETMYRPEEERQADAQRDPLVRLEALLIGEGIAGTDELRLIREEVDREINEVTDRVLEIPQPAPGTALLYVYSPDVDPAGEQFDKEDQASFNGGDLTMVDLINRCLHEELEHDPRIIVLGEDVADVSRVQHLEKVKGKGGVFKVTSNLQRRFGSERVFNTPLAEANIIGRSMGMALRGLKPIAEIQFFDYIWPAYMQMRNEIAVLRWRSYNNWKAPMVVRVPVGGYLKGGSIYHSQSGVSLFTALPGWRVVLPSTALDAYGLLRTAIRCDDPVLFLEHKHLYRQTYNKSPYPGRDFSIPFGRARLVREGTDLTIITYGALVQRSVVAAGMAAQESGINVEIIDLRTLNPYDWEAIERSVRKTSRALVAYEDPISWGYGAELAARISTELFECLDAPVRRVAALDTFVAYAPDVEDAILPQTEDLVRAIRELAEY
ncbi:MAG: alpha-ketoacid dehydrogenase subunit alpha/beta [Blastocatellia bacterium]|jgi:2-oxoisovalerate dehydrogenase E1 component